ncbi:bifunctional biotin--[acetyl-CoA-carboxylase] ligase/biotin operon repressor BirA [Solemya velesiana gill symbiont]|uniref:Bifunctional ligase/repressor BirA n=1 Tax=Solemya velesiana gill symbiont TaxID=1918948 RepID=A0A1T2KPI0_9GAMM|nr:bifunctional biotin--[acetyl-CoA-carboxylase] ligase/biotin operon repressor BirA [Solemya velesiana gill symbiont]OOZ34616.1 biotin--[acetyl-CoA-carboxylase] ligase [Solemya velesiana gill symbiont]
MDTRFKIIRLLSDGQFHSGEELAERFDVSRAAIWKHLTHIRDQMEIKLFAVRGRGYKLAEPLELLDEALIRDGLSDRASGLMDQLEILDQIASTNSYLMDKQAQEGSASGHVCIAEQQTAGRGRRGREWVSPCGSNIYLSIGWHYGMGLADLSGLSLAAGIAVARSLEAVGIDQVGLKWPNDVLWQDRKLAGLLLEVSGEHAGPSRVVMGLGLNTRMSDSQGQAIDQPWIDLASLPGGENISRNCLVSTLLENLLSTLSRFESEGLSPEIDEWRRLDLYHGKAVTLQMGNRRIEGVHKGIDAAGALLLEHQGATRPYHGGEVSLRPVG